MNIHYLLQLADDALILGHRLNEWCGHGPVLEQDIAMTNISLDHLGRARSLYQYAAECYAQLPVGERGSVFQSMQLNNMAAGGHTIDEDDLAYLRDEWDFRNVLLAEQPNTDWAYTVARGLFLDAFNLCLYTAMQGSADERLAAIAEKSVKEITYHLRWSSEWVIRLGDGTEESHRRIAQAVNELWVYTGELFVMPAATKMLAAAGKVVDTATLRPQWEDLITAVLKKAKLDVPPTGGWIQQGGKDGRHTEHLGYILAELQYMQRSYPGMKW
jgi:ring-1,2-phenylacetyl-CoA epoxidase subunit PaaC